MNLSSITGVDFGNVLLMIGFVCLLHLPATELRRPVHLKFWKEMKEMNSTQEFIRKYVNKGAVEDQFMRVIGKQRTSNGRNILQRYENTLLGSIRQELPTALTQQSSVMPCIPLNTFVPTPIDEDPSYERIPECTLLLRCAGCCGPIFSCLPTSIVPVTVTVYRGIPGPDAVFTPVNVTMDSHTACECLCGILAVDCNPDTHIYSSEECSCHCRNADQATSCSSQKTWNEKECRCICRNITNCLDDEVFNFSTCSCERKPSNDSGVQ